MITIKKSPPQIRTGGRPASTWVLVEVEPNSDADCSLHLWAETAIKHLSGEGGLLMAHEIGAHSLPEALVAFAQMYGAQDSVSTRLSILRQLATENEIAELEQEEMEADD